MAVPRDPAGVLDRAHLRPRGEHALVQRHRLGRPFPGEGLRRCQELRSDLHPAGDLPGLLRQPLLPGWCDRAARPRALPGDAAELQDSVLEPLQGHHLLSLPHQRCRDRPGVPVLLSSRRHPRRAPGRRRRTGHPAVARRPERGQPVPRRVQRVAVHGVELRAVPRRDPVGSGRAVRSSRPRRRNVVRQVPLHHRAEHPTHSRPVVHPRNRRCTVRLRDAVRDDRRRQRVRDVRHSDREHRVQVLQGRTRVGDGRRPARHRAGDHGIQRWLFPDEKKEVAS